MVDKEPSVFQESSDDEEKEQAAVEEIPMDDATISPTE